MTIKILFVGQDWHGSNATSYKRAFRQLHCDVNNIDEWDCFPQWRSSGLKVLRRVLRRVLATELCTRVESEAAQFQPDLIFVFKGSMIKKSTLQNLKKVGALLFNFYPDVDLYKHYQYFGNDFLGSVPYYDCIFTPKSYHIHQLQSSGAKQVEFLPYAFDPSCHFPVTLEADERQRFESDVAFVGTWGAERAAFLSKVVAKDFNHSLAIWGNQWDRIPIDSPLRKFTRLAPANGMTQAKVLSGTKIALAFLSPPDLHTARTFEIPAFGAFMLAERSAEHTLFFEEDREIACFRSVDEMKAKIDFYLAHPVERSAIGNAGYVKVTQHGHSYIDRAQYVLEVFQSIVARNRSCYAK